MDSLDFFLCEKFYNSFSCSIQMLQPRDRLIHMLISLIVPISCLALPNKRMKDSYNHIILNPLSLLKSIFSWTESVLFKTVKLPDDSHLEKEANPSD